MDDAGGAAVGCAAMIIPMVISLAIYAYVSYSFMVIAQKVGAENAWWAWVPILNIILLLNITQKPIWWIVLFLIPFVNIVIGAIVMMGVAEARGKPGWMGLLILVPFIGLAIPGYLAFAD